MRNLIQSLKEIIKGIEEEQTIETIKTKAEITKDLVLSQNLILTEVKQQMGPITKQLSRPKDKIIEESRSKIKMLPQTKLKVNL